VESAWTSHHPEKEHVVHRKTLAAVVAFAAALAVGAPAAQADSISYVKDGDVWLSSSDGDRQVRLTTSGAYSDASQSDDGTIIALTGVRLHRLDRTGRVLADFDTPVSDTRPPRERQFFGPYEPAINRDGTMVAYSWYHRQISQNPDCFPPACVTTLLRQGVGYSHADRQTGWEEIGRMTGWVHPAWMPDGRVMLSTPGRMPNADVVTDNVLDSSNTTWANWFTDNSTSHVSGGDITRDGGKLAFVTGDGDDAMRLYRGTGAAPALPEACYQYLRPVGGKAGTPTWSPDGTQLAWAEGDGVRVVTVPDFSAGCTTDGASPTTTLLIPGATEPDWGPADLPAEVTLTPTPRPLGDALTRGLLVRAAGAPAGRIALEAHMGDERVARGSAAVSPDGRGTVRLRFTAAARRALEGAGEATLRITGAGASVEITLQR
jgi:hypothetical protein